MGRYEPDHTNNKQDLLTIWSSRSSQPCRSVYLRFAVGRQLILAARNNIRAMMKGDLAFFYHSNCKVPGIAGVMEIVREHSVDGNEYAFPRTSPCG